MIPRMAIAALCLVAASARAESPDAAIGRGEIKRILFLGDSITWDGRYVADVEAWFALRYPQRHIEVINAGLPSETVSGLSEEGHANGAFPRPNLQDRLQNLLEKSRPDWVFACYGMNCGIYLPFDETRFTAFREGISRLRESVAAAGAGLTLLTPPVYDPSHAPHAVPGYDAEVLERYSAWQVANRAAGIEVIDLHSAMRVELARRRAAAPDFAFSPDGIHPGEEGHWCIAQQIIRYLGDEDSAAAPSAAAMLGARAGILPLLHERMSTLRDAWLSHAGHKRPGLPSGIPLEGAQARAAVLTERILEIATPRK